MLDERYKLAIGVPSSDEYRRMRVLAGLSPKSAEGADRGLPNSIYGVLIHCDERLVGMGRVIGDGGLFFQIVDIAVDPAHQGRGLGKATVRALVEHLKKTAPVGAYVSLIADGKAKYLYAQFGFTETAPASVGMSFSIK